MYLFFDTETNGLPKRWGAPVNDLLNWPPLVQIAWMVYDDKIDLIKQKDVIIRPEGFKIDPMAAQIHGITQEIADKEGIELQPILEEFALDISRSTTIVAHNIAFDEMIVGAEFLRKEIKHKLFQKERLCTMKESTDFCQIPGKRGYKWPKLQELHKKLFGYEFEEAHNAKADINATAKCFWELRKRQIL